MCCQTNVFVKTSDRFQIVFLRINNFIQIGQPKNIFYVLDISVAKNKKPSFYSMVLKSAEHIVYFWDFLAWLLIWSSIMSAKKNMILDVETSFQSMVQNCRNCFYDLQNTKIYKCNATSKSAIDWESFKEVVPYVVLKLHHTFQ